MACGHLLEHCSNGHQTVGIRLWRRPITGRTPVTGPAQLGTSFGRISQQGLHLRRAEVLLRDLPVGRLLAVRAVSTKRPPG